MTRFPDLIRRSLQVRLIVLLLVASILPLALTIWFAQQEFSHLKNTTEENARTLAAHVLDTLDRVLFERYGDTQFISQVPEVRAMEADRLTAIAGVLVTTYKPYYTLVVVADRSGIIRAVNAVGGDGQPIPSQQLVGQSVSGQSWFEQALTSPGIAVFDFQTDPLVQHVYGPDVQRTMTFASRIEGSPVKGEEGRTVGVWSTRIPESAIAQMLRQAETPVEQYDRVRIALFAKNGHLIGTLGGYDGQASLDSMLQPLASISSSGFGAYQGLGWRISVYPSNEEGVFRTPFAITVSAGIMVSILLGLTLIWRQTSRHVLQPLKTLADAAQQIEQGQAVIIPQDTNRADAIGVLQGKLAGMVDTIKADEAAAQAASAVLKKQADALQFLVRSIKEITTESDDLGRFLHRLAETACALTDARYGAVGLFDQEGTRLTEFITIGLDEAARAAIGALPEGRGVLRELAHSDSPLRLKDLTAHQASVGFPPRHPPMHSFLGASIKTHGRLFGRLYLTEKQHGDEFTDTDEQIIAAFASQAGVLIENTLLLQDVCTTRTSLKASNQELENFVYAISHDLQTPLRAIHGFADLLVGQSKDHLSEKEQHYLNRIQAGIKRMENLIQDLLEYSRIERMAQAFAWVSMGDLLNKILNDLADVIQTSGATIDLEGRMPRLWADHTRLMQVWTNLLTNAIKYVTPGTVPHIVLRCREEKDHFVFEVQDNGIGIAPEFHERIFKLFHRLHLSGVYTGTGVGLAIVKRVVEFHRGKIWVESAEGQGSTFCFTIPKPANSHKPHVPAATLFTRQPAHEI
jgi:signal transduction histidine kinase/HAMP domain-containing protein